MGSYIMLSDENTMNNINPFVIDGPGASNKPYGYAPASPIKESGTWDNTQDKPLCMWGIAANTNGGVNQEQCLPIKNPISCYLDRPIEPTRDIVPDLYTLIPFTESTSSPTQNPKWPIIVLLLLILALLIKFHVIKSP